MYVIFIKKFIVIFLAKDDGGCKHAVALLFSFSLWSERHIDRYTKTCTDRKSILDVSQEPKPKLLDEQLITCKTQIYIYHD